MIDRDLRCIAVCVKLLCNVIVLKKTSLTYNNFRYPNCPLIDWFIEAEFDGQILVGNEYWIPLTAVNNEQLKEQVDYLFSEINMIANDRNCLVIDCLLTNDQTRQGWDDCAGCWQCESA
ncbi:hypothetical protein SAMN05216516_1156 [Izhakiella capsodis]|uniref:Uncharacterized protein n=1 Tax=Izhakiella capsodis TaxID=1367852 RepID=A0A1I5B7X6_9GAMM|nr:hypothetical protein SAMN05216516_1156 [Izhakiella capsodis]